MAIKEHLLWKLWLALKTLTCQASDTHGPVSAFKYVLTYAHMQHSCMFVEDRTGNNLEIGPSSESLTK